MEDEMMQIPPTDTSSDDIAAQNMATDDDSGSDPNNTIIGISTGEFFQPADITADSVIEITSVNGDTNNRFEWGTAVEDSFTSLLQFDGGDFFGAKPEQPFKLGQIFYRNGTIVSDTGFDGEFAFSVELDIDGVEDDPDPFVYLFDILNTENTTGDPVQDADILRFSSSGLTPQTFELDGDTFTLELLGFSQDGGQTFANGFDSPEEGFDIANLYGRLIQVSDGDDDDDDDRGGGSGSGSGGSSVSFSFYSSLSVTTVTSIQVAGGVFIGGTNGAVAGSAIIDDGTQLGIVWSTLASASRSFTSSSTFELTTTSSTTVSLSALGISAAIFSDGDDTVEGSVTNDAISCGDGNDMVDADSGNDVVLCGNGDDIVSGGVGIDIVNGNQGNDMIMGEDGDDLLHGGKGNDNVMGGDGDDALFGDIGVDIITGGGGRDTFVLNVDVDTTVMASFSTDFIVDFQSGEDRIALAKETLVTFEVKDFNADGTDDVGIQLEGSGLLVGVVLNTTNVAEVQQSMFVAPEGDFAFN